MNVYDFKALLESREKRNVKTVIAIGVFDGVHRGHQEIFRTLIDEREKQGADEAMVISFSKNPKKSASGSLDTMRLREEYVSSFSINSFVIIDFSDSFSKISASGFIKMLLDLCRPLAVVVGRDFRLGNPASAATADDLSSLFAKDGADVKVNIVEPILTEGGEKISSTLLRTIIRLGKLKEFRELSGQCYRVDLVPITYRFISGDLVFRGDLIHQLLPPLGAYEAKLVFCNGIAVNGILKIGEEFLHFSSASLHSVFGIGHKSSKEELQLDSIFLGET